MILEETLAAIRPADADAREEARAYILSLTMPPWALGRLLDLAVDLAGMTGRRDFPTARKRIVVMAADHGIVRQPGVAAQPPEITVQMVRNFAAGGACVNALARTVGAEVVVADFGMLTEVPDLVAAGRVRDCRVAAGTRDLSVGPAMTRGEARQAIESGIRLAMEFAPHTDIFAPGEMGIGNTSASSAVLAAAGRIRDLKAIVGPGAALPPDRLERKIAAIARGLEVNDPDPDDALDILSKVGGFEIGGIAGLCLGAAAMRKPVLLDGFIAGAGALIAAKLAPDVRDYLIMAHGSSEPGHVYMAELLGQKPLLDLGLHLGEGSGAALAMPLVDAARAVMTRVATFAGARVSRAGLYDLRDPVGER